MLRSLALSLSALVVACGDPSAREIRPTDAETACSAMAHAEMSFVVCAFILPEADIRLFHSDALGQPYLQFDTLVREMDEQGKTLIFAMNGGMYHEDRSPVGFLRDSHGDHARINVNDGPGNFHLKPNGVFWIENGRSGITESVAYLDLEIDPDYATQSGPMLVIDGVLHPDISASGTSRKRRNGVGVSADGQTVYFAISDSAVTFHEFATLFLEKLSVPNALFLDGQVSRIYAPQISRNEVGADLGPIVGVVQ